jgi:hypothetical protein
MMRILLVSISVNRGTPAQKTLSLIELLLSSRIIHDCMFFAYGRTEHVKSAFHLAHVRIRDAGRTEVRRYAKPLWNSRTALSDPVGKRA